MLERNGYENHVSYDQQLEAEREKFINKDHRVVRFHHLVGLKTLVNGILHAQVGNVVKLYDVNHIYSGYFQSTSVGNVTELR